MKLLKRFLAAEAKSFRDMELLVTALEYLELTTEAIASLERYIDKLLSYAQNR